MNQIQIYRNIFIEKAGAVIDRAIVIFSRMTGLSYEMSQIVLIVIICYLVWIYILVKIHRKLFKRKINAQKACVFEYDNILYLIAQEEQKTNSVPLETKGNPAQLGKGGLGGICTSPIHELMNAKHKNYLQNHQLIIDAIRKLEAETKHILFTPEMEKKIISLRKKIAIANIIQKIFWILVSLGTAWIYLLFR